MFCIYKIHLCTAYHICFVNMFLLYYVSQYIYMAVAFKKRSKFAYAWYYFIQDFFPFSFLEGHKIPIWGIIGDLDPKMTWKSLAKSFRLIAVIVLKGPFSQNSLVFSVRDLFGFGYTTCAALNFWILHHSLFSPIGPTS